MAKWLDKNVEPNIYADLKHYSFSATARYKEWQSKNAAWRVRIAGMKPTITVIIKDEQIATMFALIWR